MPERPELVLVAGWGVPARIWEPLRPFLEPCFRLGFLDLLDYAATPEAMADRLMERAPARAQWLGWSLGGQIALLAARRHPERVERLHLWASNPCFVTRPDHPDAMALATFRTFRQDFLQSPETAWRRFLALQCQGCPQPRQTLRLLQSLAGDALPAPAALLDRQLGWLESLDLRAIPATVGCPVSRLQAAGDALIPVPSGHDVPGATVTVLPEAGHVFFLSSPGAAVRTLSGVGGETP